MFGMFDQKVAIDDRWALLGNIGWQDWSEFGEVEIGIDNTQNPVSLTNSLSFDDTWHVVMGAQYRTSKQWKVNVGLAYDSGFQDGNDVPAPLYGGNMQVDLVGPYDQTLAVVLTVYGNWAL